MIPQGRFEELAISRKKPAAKPATASAPKKSRKKMTSKNPDEDSHDQKPAAEPTPKPKSASAKKKEKVAAKTDSKRKETAENRALRFARGDAAAVAQTTAAPTLIPELVSAEQEAANADTEETGVSAPRQRQRQRTSSSAAPESWPGPWTTAKVERGGKQGCQ